MKKELLDYELEENSEDDSIYTKRVRDELLEDDELSPLEAGFMEGYDSATY